MSCFKASSTKTEMRTLGAIAIKIFTLVFVFFKSSSKHLLSFFHLHADLGQIAQFKRRPVFIDYRFQIYTVKLQVTVFYIKTFLRKIEGLLNEVKVGICHRPFGGLS